MRKSFKMMPKYSELFTVTYKAIKALGGSETNDEINQKGANC